MYKIYANGNDFLDDNNSILKSFPLDTAFFRYNAKIVKQFARDSFFIKIFDDFNNYLLLSRYSDYNLLLYGSPNLCDEAVNVLLDYNLEFCGLIADEVLSRIFLEEYEKKMGGSHKTKLSLDLMYCKQAPNIANGRVTKCTPDDYYSLVRLVKEFQIEATRSAPNCDDVAKLVCGLETNFYCIRENKAIVSIAKKTRIEDDMCSISAVYTKPEYRNKGYSQEIVSYLTNLIIQENKIAYLFVDKNNEVSNHIYDKIGYRYYIPRYEIIYTKGHIKTVLLALSEPSKLAEIYTKVNGIRRTLVGYSGGMDFNPTKEVLESNTTKYRRTLLIEYDSNIVTFEKVLDIYIDYIEPFKMNCYAMFSSNLEEVKDLRSKILELEINNLKKVYIDVMPCMLFYAK